MVLRRRKSHSCSVKEVKVGWFFFKKNLPRLHRLLPLPTLFSLSHTPAQPTAGAFIFPLSCPSLLLPFYSSRHLPSVPLFFFFFFSRLFISLSLPSQRVTSSHLSVSGGWRHGWMQLGGASSPGFCCPLVCQRLSRPASCPVS